MDEKMNKPLKDENHIPLDQCQDRHVYKLDSRNLSVGVFRKSTSGFIGIRNKFGSDFLFEEYHWDTGPPFGTVKPLLDIAVLPENIELIEGFSYESNTDRRIERNFETKECFDYETGEKLDNPKLIYKDNEKLFDYLKTHREQPVN